MTRDTWREAFSRKLAHSQVTTVRSAAWLSLPVSDPPQQQWEETWTHGSLPCENVNCCLSTTSSIFASTCRS